MSDDTRRIVDPHAARCLDDVGLASHVLTLCVDRNGLTSAWLVDWAQIDQPGTDHGLERPPHELLGPLPPHWRARVARTAFRCGAPTTRGRHCRVRVHHPDARCHRHAEPGDCP